MLIKLLPFLYAVFVSLLRKKVERAGLQVDWELLPMKFDVDRFVRDDTTLPRGPD